MKTILIQDGATLNVEIKTDILATMTELQEVGFETRFTNMDIQGYDDAAKEKLDIKLTENSWQDVIVQVTDAGLSLSVFDVSENEVPVEIVASSQDEY